MASSLQVPLQAQVTGRAKPGRRKCSRRQPFHFPFSPRSHMAGGALPGLDGFPGLPPPPPLFNLSPHNLSQDRFWPGSLLHYAWCPECHSAHLGHLQASPFYQPPFFLLSPQHLETYENFCCLPHYTTSAEPGSSPSCLTASWPSATSHSFNLESLRHPPTVRPFSRPIMPSLLCLPHPGPPHRLHSPVPCEPLPLSVRPPQTPPPPGARCNPPFL